MPGTRKKGVSRGNTPLTMAEDEPSSRKAKQSPDRRKPDSEESKKSETAVTSPPTNKQRKQAAANEEPPSNLSADEKKMDKSTPIAAAGRRGRPKKEEMAETQSKGAEEKGAAGKGVGKALSRSKEGEAPSTVFSPRRSGRSVVPNSRFKDMELDLGAIGRKRPKDDTADAPASKRVKMSDKNQSPEKGKNSPVKRSTTKQSIRPETELKPVSTTTTTASKIQAESVTVSTPICTAPPPLQAAPSSTGKASSVVTATVLSSPLPKSVSKTPTPPKPVSRTVCVTKAVSRSTPASVTSVSSSRPSLVSATVHSRPTVCQPEPVLLSQSAESAGLVSVLSSVVSSRTASVSRSSPKPSVSVSQSEATSLSVTAPLSLVTATVTSPSISSCTVSVTNPPSILPVQSPSHPEETVAAASPGKALPDEHTSSMSTQSCDEEFAGDASCQSVSQMEITEAVTLVADLTEAAEVEIVDEPEQAGDNSSDIVTVTPPPQSLLGGNDKRGVDTPGRVVSKPSMSPTSKAVFIVGPSPSQTESSSVDRSPHKPSLLSTALTEAANIATTVKKEAGVGDVMSIVELSPNKKVPVVLAERKEHAGKVVKVISSSQQIQQLPPAVQKIVSSKVSPSTSVKEGSVSLLQQQQPKSVTVRITTPAQSASGSSDNNSKKEETLTQEPAHPTQESSDGKIHAASTTSSSQPLSVVEATSKESEEATADTESTVQTQACASTSMGDNTVSSENKSSDGSEGEETKEEDAGKEKYVTSSTQTPYTKNYTKKVITVHVHPPSKDGEKNTEIVTVTREEKEDPSSDLASGSKEKEEDQQNRKAKVIIVDLPEGSTAKQSYVHCPDDLDTGDSMDTGEEGEETQEEGKEELRANKKYIIVDLPEGTTIKQQYARRTERIDADPDFYTMDEKGLFTCNICQYQTYRRPNFYKHKKKHLGLRPYSCDQCSYRAATTSNLKRHQEIHKDIRNHKCPICNLYFRQKIHLERHIKYRHEEKKVRCPLCEYVCANENPDLKVHIKRRHMPQLGSQEVMNAFKCKECGIVANSKKDLRQHLKFHSKGPELKLFCNMCSFVTDCESRLRRHKYIHTKEKPFHCGLCDYRGSQKEHVMRHMRTQHNIEFERKHRIKKPGSEKGGEGEGGKGLEKADYTSDEKIFACNHCKMMFSKLINLYKHLHTQHRDIMPAEKDDFSCVVCDFRTSNKKNLLVHMRRHNVTDQPPPSHVYSCVLCRYMNPKRRNLFQHMRKKHHIEIVLKDDGSSTCYVSNDSVATVGGNSGALISGQPLSVQQMAQSTEPVVSVLPLTDLISTVTQPSELQVAADTSTITMSTAAMPATIKMEDLALVVSNPHTAPATVVGRESMGMGPGLVDGSGVETFTISGFSQDDAAEAIQGLQALAHRGVLDSGAIVEEQVQVMGSDDQTTLVIDPTGLSVVDQLVQPKTEPLQVVEIDNTHILDHDPSSSSSSTSLLAHSSMLADTSTPTPISTVPGEDTGFQLSAEQLMNLSTGEYLVINGEMFKVEVSTEGTQGQRIISFEPVASTTACPQDLIESLEPSEVSLESAPELS